MLWLAPTPLVIASKSAVRRAILADAGFPLEVTEADIDERAVETRGGPVAPDQAALLLAREKARVAAARFAGHYVVGADQTLALGERRFNKPATRAAARDQLRALSGQTHALHSAVAVAKDGRVIFGHVETARLTMRRLTDRFLDAYLDAAGEAVTSSVGAYQLERLGIHLFERIDGDHFTILGLPLFPLLAFLRREGCLAG
ncbi:Maf family protein [Rhodoplanes sp. TEM]|uniref:Nucleoside triphosphate pyrophosphatase n=1 Tax=Rhodoplanes tepidamans TaxID=200616 RepID=A0ABT5J3K9_RHOTP|nr:MULTISPECIES: Maf family protein [Rhodoplanes]MDC7784240.1 Maf family protein [Rhodoplanes tepidamans]MDC7983632.1 Maf family protein [Rhodoplanes sp. TEM]MDQ0353639.1 septum formation protein [Rhodoplanes tepidamans]